MRDSSMYHPTLVFGLLLVGPPKRGKTTLALSFPKPWIADCDNNLPGAIRFHLEKDPNFKFKYDCINIADDSQLCKDWGLKDGDLVPSEKRWLRLVECAKAAAKDPEIWTLIFDSLASIDTYLQDYIVSQKDEKKEKQMTISDWIPYKNMMTKLVTTFRSIGKPFIMTSHERVEKDEGTGVLVYKVNMSGSLQDNFGGFFSDVWACEAEKFGDKWKYYVQTMPQPRRALGNSLGLPDNYDFSWADLKARLDKLNKLQ